MSAEAQNAPPPAAAASGPYAKAGVDVASAAKLTNTFAKIALPTARRGLVGSIGSFAGLFDISALPYRRPLLVSATDGVGTKLLLAKQQGRLDGIGQDLVAMCANDILCCGAEPLFFLDYFACGRLDSEQARQLVSSIAQACQEIDCALLGGETAEMPGLYREGDFDLAGFCVGAVEAERLLEPANVKPGDAIIALPSSGVHSNGYSLVRKLLDESPPPPPHIMEALLKPTTLYTPALRKPLERGGIRALAHITGGGLRDNLARVLPEGLGASIDLNWALAPVFEWIAKQARLDTPALLEIFNGGVGMVAITSAEHSDQLLDDLADLPAWRLGTVLARQGRDPVSINP